MIIELPIPTEVRANYTYTFNDLTLSTPSMKAEIIKNIEEYVKTTRLRDTTLNAD